MTNSTFLPTKSSSQNVEAELRNQEVELRNQEVEPRNQEVELRNQEVEPRNQDRNLFFKGVIVGGIIGGALSLRDYRTRMKVMDTAASMKESTVELISQVKENPKDTKEELVQRFNSASTSLKEAIQEAQSIYNLVDDQLLGITKGKKSVANNIANAANLVDVAVEAKEKAKETVTKVSEAGKSLTGSQLTISDREKQNIQK
ncbi:hypothetical protein ACIQZD_06000 [Peribacillus sp. NPDC096447]|uniref:hypothetical protein n=1 Tax=Peribacillus sp. NPDC096447 TaxID=3364394 RepID=UPI00380A8732